MEAGEGRGSPEKTKKRIVAMFSCLVGTRSGEV
jgi:hypothetical protein